MNEVVIVEAVRSPTGRRNGALSTLHALDLLGTVLGSLFERTGVDPAEVGQVIGGCVNQVGMQTFNVTRGAWLAAGLPLEVAATTIDTQCGSSQQAAGLAYAMIAAGVLDSAVACGVEMMSRVPMGSAIPSEPGLGTPYSQSYLDHYEPTTQFEGAERIAEKYGISRSDCDALGKTSQDRAAIAWAQDRFASQIVPIDVPEFDATGLTTGLTSTVARDGGLRETTLDALASLKPVGRPNGVHTAGSTSQVADGASAVLMMSADRARQLGVVPLATIVDTCLVGIDPILMLEGPIPATKKILDDNSLSLSDIDVVEVNEAFASVVLAWQRSFDADMTNVNPNGGAIALGHPLGATGTLLITKAVHELVRTGGTLGLVTMCCGGGLGTGTLLRRG
jgi:acetyl-CoA C-acetyltransferase